MYCGTRMHIILSARVETGKTIQVISFLSAIMSKFGDVRDVARRRKHISHLQDVSTEWKMRRKLPPANATWPTCLIIAPSSVVGNWQREFETVCRFRLSFPACSCVSYVISGDTLRLGCIQAHLLSEPRS